MRRSSDLISQWEFMSNLSTEDSWSEENVIFICDKKKERREALWKAQCPLESAV